MALRTPTEFWLPKAGNAPEEYEDAFRVVCRQQVGASGLGAARVAVSDGASESPFAREWANMLTEAFVAEPPVSCGLTEDSLNTWLKSPQERWHGSVPWDRLPWHGEAKTQAGAFATLLGLTIKAAPDNSEQLFWQALAVGDSCLFIIRDDRLWLSFPLEDAAQFDNTPALLCSNPDNAGNMWEGMHQHSGECTAGDLLILATDALACWFLAQNATGEKPWETLLALDWAEGNAWIEEQRREGLMRNDDTTLIIIEAVQDSEVKREPCPGRG